MTQDITDNSLKNNVQGNHSREGKVYRKVLKRFVRNELKQIQFNACPECGCVKFEIGPNYLNHVTRCSRCWHIQNGNFHKAPNRKQIRLIKAIIREIGVLAIRRVAVKYGKQYIEL